MHKHLLSSTRLVAVTLLVPSLLALFLAVILQYGFHYYPCALCIYERWPYFVSTIIAIGLLLTENGNRFLIYFAVASLLSGTLITLYHIGIEMHIFTMAENCAITYRDTLNIANLYEQIATNEIVRCDDPQKLLGIRLTYLNLLYSLGSALLVIFVCIKNESRSTN
ncbi:disulfide bond formation protein B [Neorickettsia risticii]|nr:disulfide bond formation protein B [Neorickettsia risticii]